MRCEWRSCIAMSAGRLGAAATVLAVVAMAQAQQPAAGNGREIFARVCGACHSTELATSSRRTRQQWLQTVGQMRRRGAAGSDEEFLAVVDYLSAHYGRVNVNTATAGEIASSTGLSPEQAAAVVAYRGKHGVLDGFDALRKIPGLDVNRLEASRDALTFGIEVPGVGRVPVSALTQANNWPTAGGSPQRDGWAKNEEFLSKDTVKALKLLYRYKLDNQSEGLRSLTDPVVLGSLYAHQGIKQMLILGGSSDRVYAIDADLDREIWSRHLDRRGEEPQVAPKAPCPAALTTLVIPGATTPGGSPFGDLLTVGPIFTVSRDGYLHTLYQSNGAEENAPARIVPVGSRVSGLNINKTTIYASTAENCGSASGIYALDVASVDRKVVSFATNGSGPSGTAGTAIGSNGIVYAQIADGAGDAAGKYNDTVLALTANDLQVRDYFTPSETLPTLAKDTAPQGVTPAVFQWKAKEVVVAGGRDGRLYLLDSASLGGADHHTPLYRSEPVASTDAGCGIRGAFATWEDANTKTRWVYASLWGPAKAGAKFPVTNGAAPNGAIAAFKVEDRDGKPALVLAWVSRDLIAPAAPIAANGLVFALSTGQPARLVRDHGIPYSTQEFDKMADTAMLYALDSATGKELFSSGKVASSFSYGSGLAVANGHIYFTTHDNAVYAYGFPMEH